MLSATASTTGTRKSSFKSACRCASNELLSAQIHQLVPWRMQQPVLNLTLGGPGGIPARTHAIPVR
jgi:hypothetical protein